MSEYQKGRERGYELGKLTASDAIQAMTDTIEALRAENARLLQLLEEALAGYEDCISYKSEYLVEKHGDKEEVARIRAAMGESDE